MAHALRYHRFQKQLDKINENRILISAWLDSGLELSLLRDDCGALSRFQGL